MHGVRSNSLARREGQGPPFSASGWTGGKEGPGQAQSLLRSAWRDLRSLHRASAVDGQPQWRREAGASGRSY